MMCAAPALSQRVQRGLVCSDTQTPIHMQTHKNSRLLCVIFHVYKQYDNIPELPVLREGPWLSISLPLFCVGTPTIAVSVVVVLIVPNAAGNDGCDPPPSSLSSSLAAAAAPTPSDRMRRARNSLQSLSSSAMSSDDDDDDDDDRVVFIVGTRVKRGVDYGVPIPIPTPATATARRATLSSVPDGAVVHPAREARAPVGPQEKG